MHSADGQHIGRAKDRLRCRGCGYSLRGLPGVHVRCPECGRINHVLHALSRRRSDWSSNRLYQPLNRAATAGVSMTFAWLLAALVTWPMPLLPLIVVIAIVLTVGWAVLLRRAATTGLTATHAVLMAAVLHGVVAGYLVAMLGVMATLFFLLPISYLTAGIGNVNISGLIWIGAGALITVSGLGLIGWLSHVVDRRIGLACLRRSIESPPTRLRDPHETPDEAVAGADADTHPVAIAHAPRELVQ